MPSMDFRTAGARVRSLIAAKKPQQLQSSALGPDVLRDNIVSESIADSPRFRAAREQVPQVDVEREQDDGSKVREQFTWDTFGEAITDVARAGFGWEEPEVAGRDRVRPSHQFNREVVASMLASEEFASSRPYTRDNAPEALFGAMAAASVMREKAGEVAEHVARSQEMSDAEEEIASAEAMLEQLRERAREQHNELQGIDPNVVEQIKHETASRQRARGRLEQLIADHQASNARTAAAALGKAAANEHAEAVQAVGQIPGLDPGQARNLTPDQRIALAEKWANNKMLRDVAKMLGRLIRDMRFKRQARSRNVAVEPVSITTGQDITRMLPHELARGHMPALRALWVKDYSARSLLEWEMGGKAPAGKGPIVFVYDGSGSMGGEPIVWASSVGLALLTIAQREKRAFAGVEFGSASEMKSWFFAAREPADPDQVLDFASHFFGGGTSILTGLREAARIIASVPEFKSADVVLCGDGQDYFREPDRKIVADMRAAGVRIHGISICCPENAYMRQACEYVVDVQDLAGANGATDALAENLT